MPHPVRVSEPPKICQLQSKICRLCMHTETHVQEFKHALSGLSRNARCGFRNSFLRQHRPCSIEICSEADGAGHLAVNNDCASTVGHRHTDDFCAINCALVAPDLEHPVDRRGSSQ